MTEIKWQEPPTDGRSGDANLTRVLAELRANPGRWALVYEGVHASRASYIKARPGFEATSRKSATVQRRCDIYARYVGEAA